MVHDLIKRRPNSGSSRRGFLQAIAITGGAVGALGIGNLALAQTAIGAKKLALKMAGYNFDRLAALVDGQVGVVGRKVSFEKAAIGDMNTDMFSGRQP